MTTERAKSAMGKSFFGTGKPPEGYQPGDYVECWSISRRKWLLVVGPPEWHPVVKYRLPADHPFYMPPIWCLDKAAQLAGWVNWASVIDERDSVIAHARTLRDGCEPMQEPVDPLVETLRAWRSSCADYAEAIAAELRARFDITPKGEGK